MNLPEFAFLYALFFFAEYTLFQFWKHIFSKRDFTLINEFDEIHLLYINGLEDWLKSMDPVISIHSGFYNAKEGLAEFA
jgi:hypothetical protein